MLCTYPLDSTTVAPLESSSGHSDMLSLSQIALRLLSRHPFRFGRFFKISWPVVLLPFKLDGGLMLMILPSTEVC